ncbi:MAG: hypothetical protein NE328_16275 [Lentisphaeraceae bacterium]|nr:hypothetical protein [Lentisphaeraceae bacterium]
MKKLTQLALAGVVTGSLVLGGLGCSSDKSSCKEGGKCKDGGKCKAKTEKKSDY